MEADPLEIAREVLRTERTRYYGQPERTDEVLAQALLAKHAEVGRLREALERLIPIMENASRDAFKNGVTDPTGSMDQGDVWACNAIDAARAALAQEAGK